MLIRIDPLREDAIDVALRLSKYETVVSPITDKPLRPCTFQSLLTTFKRTLGKERRIGFESHTLSSQRSSTPGIHSGTSGDIYSITDDLWFHNAPLQRLKSTDTCSNQQINSSDAQVFAYQDRSIDDVTDRNRRKRQHIRLSCLRINGRRTTRTIARTQHIDATHKILVCIDDISRSYQIGPPLLRIRICSEGMTDPHHFLLRCVFTRNMIGNIYSRQFSPRFKLKWRSHMQAFSYHPKLFFLRFCPCWQPDAESTTFTQNTSHTDISLHGFSQTSTDVESHTDALRRLIALPEEVEQPFL